MASQQPYRGVILAQNPRSSIQQSYASNQPQRPLQDITDQNQHLRQMIQKIRNQRENQVQKVNQQLQPEGHRVEFNRRIEQNNHKIQELEGVINSQEKVIESYREKFKDFQDNLFKIMKLDKDIHHRLVNPQPNPTLDTNVRNILVALNGRAPYDKIMKMIESIRV